MGLLDKALNFRSGTGKRTGLLERAKKLKEFIQGSDTANQGPETAAAASSVVVATSSNKGRPGQKGGLFNRATAARSTTPETATAASAIAGAGLLKRAEGLIGSDTQGALATPSSSSHLEPANIDTDFSSPELAADLHAPDFGADISQSAAPELHLPELPELEPDLAHSDFTSAAEDELYIAPAPAEFSNDLPEPTFDASDFAHQEPLGDPMILDIDLPELPESAAEKHGLLARAEQIKDHEDSWDGADAPVLDVPDFDSKPQPGGPDMAASEFETPDFSEGESPEELPGLWNELEAPTSDADIVDHEISQADEAARAHTEDSSQMADDLRLDDAKEPEESWDAFDPFSSFEQEAEKAAERELAADEKPHEEKVQPSFLFDADDDFTTAPIEAHIAGQKKIDHYLSLFDIQREISGIDNFEEFWDSVLFAVMGQLGAETVCILASRNGTEGGQTFLPVAYSGMEIGDKWALGPGDTLYDSAAKEEGVMYAESFRNLSDAMTLTEIERDMIVQSRAQIIAPLKNNGKMYGIIFLGGTHSGEDYGIDDLEFVTLLGGIAASGVDRIIARLEFARGTEVLKKRDYFHNRILEAARECSSGANLDELYDIVGRNLTEHFSVDSYSIVLLNPANQEYSIFAGNRISPESIEKFKLRTTSEIVGMVSNFTRVFEISDFRTNSELTACYTNDDLGIMKNYWIVPLIYQNWLVGFITVHSTRAPWGEFEREMIVSFAELVGASFGGAIMMGERESLFRDPFSPLEDRLRVELGRAFEFHSHLSLAELRIKNIKRILTLNPSANVTQFLASVGKTISGFLFQTDFLARIGQGRFAIILPGRGKEEAEILMKKIRNDIKRLHLLPGSPVDAQFVHTIVSTDDTHDPEKMLAILE